MNKRFVFIGIGAVILVLLPGFAIAQAEKADLTNILTRAWDFITGIWTAGETGGNIGTHENTGPLEGSITSHSRIATLEGETHGTGESVTFEVAPVQEYNISLYPGWNFISTPYQLVNETLNSFLENVDGKWNLMWLKSKEYCGAPYYCWIQNKAGVAYNIKTISNLQGYWINISQSVDKNITATGIYYYKKIEIPLYNSTYSEDYWDGWNMVGYPRDHTASVMDVLNASLGSNWTLVETYERGNWTYAIEEVPATYRDKMWTLQNITPGRAYYIKMKENDVLVIPETTKP